MAEMKLRPAPLASVTVTDAYLKNAFQKEIKYLLSLQEGRLLAGFCENAGLKTPFVRYGGWENMLIGGHTLGHYLTALAQGYVNPAASEEERQELILKIENIVDGLQACQEHSKGESGFLWGAIPAKSGGVEAQFDNVEKNRTNIVKEAWVPWYTMHKLLAGLVDVYRLTDNRRALDVASRLGDWVYRRTASWSKELNERVLSIEYGGMNDCLYALYECTGKEEHARAAHAFDEETLFDKILTEGKDVLKDRHANTTIPKILGALNRYLVLHGKTLGGERIDATRYFKVAEVFFKTVVERHTYVTGGNSEWEHFGADYVLDGERTNCNCETCNVYNMLKLARLLYCETGDRRYADYYDNAFTNTILSSQNPETGMTTYFQPMAGGFFKCFSTPYDKFWCCTGSGMESFTKLGDGMFYLGEGGLYVERYISSVYRDEERELSLDCDFPLSDTAKISVRRARFPFMLYLRIPDWCAGELCLYKNGMECTTKGERGHVAVEVKTGDELVLKIPVTVTLHTLPDGDAVAFCYGGAALSVDLGNEDMRETETGVSVTIPARRKKDCERVFFADAEAVRRDPARFLVRDGDTFTLQGGDVPLTFGLHYRRYKERYAIYLRLLEGERTEEKETREPFDTVQPGYGQYEDDELHALDERNSVGVTADGTCRYARAGGYFAYDFAVDPQKRNILSIGLKREDNGKTLKISLGGETIACERLLYTLGEDGYRREIELPAEMIVRHMRKKRALGQDNTVVNLRFEGEQGAESARVCEFIYIYTE